MAYEKHIWNCGDTITADKMNHIEDGIANASSGGGGGKVFQIVGGQGTCGGEIYYEFDFTYQDALEAVADATPCWYLRPGGGYALVVYCNPHMVKGVYAVDVIYVDAIHVDPDGGEDITPNLTAMTVYSDTEDGNLRTHNCWEVPT